MIYTTIDNFYVTEEQLANSPSRRDGVSEETETQLRIYGCELIQEGGILLRLPQAVMATGQVLLHRFYCKESMLRFNIKRVAWACCWLATKLEETPRRIRDLLSVFVRIDKRREGRPLTPLDIYSKEFENRKQELINVERHLLRTFGFVLHVDHPHKFVLNYLNIFLKADQMLKQEAWNLANDSLRTTCCVRFKGDTVACGIIFLAARRLKITLPEDPPWWELFEVDKAEMFTVAREVHTLFSKPKMTYISLFRGHSQQSPRDTGTTKDSTPMVSPNIAQGTPGLSGVESEQERDSIRVKDGSDGRASLGSGNGGSRDSHEEPMAMDIDRKKPDEEHKKDKHKRSRKDREGDEDNSERRRRRYRKKEGDGGSEARDEKAPKRDKDPDRKREKRERERERDKEAPRDKERERIRSERSGRERER